MGSSSNVIEVNDQNFAQEVLQTDTPVLVDFSASWCAPCKRLAPIVDEIAAETAGQVKVVKLDVDESPAAAQRFGIRGLPTVVAFQKGEPVGRHIGLTNKKTLLALLGR
ncbi:thioredoxin [Sorangium sp. So ce381]|uniref:thioredoxin n=1 Tax=unclassified Sorangium TaxID=2621164 RepID=UPI003F5C8FB8